jgi:hypothetical protein
MRITVLILTAVTLLGHEATARAEDPCAAGVVGADRFNDQPVILVRTKCFQAMDLTYSLHRLDEQTITILRGQTRELRLGIKAMARSSSVAWSHASEQNAGLVKALRRAESAEGRLVEVLEGRNLRDLIIAGLTLVGVVVSVWALSQVKHEH